MLEKRWTANRRLVQLKKVDHGPKSHMFVGVDIEFTSYEIRNVFKIRYI